jgi:hypothetical protein
LAYGDVRWYSLRIYLPYTATEKFDWAVGGTNAFNVIWDIHIEGTGPSPLSLQWYGGSTANRWIPLRVQAVSPSISYNLIQLTDSAGNRVMANHNRWIDVVIGIRHDNTSAGWVEAWVDGQNVLPRTSRQTLPSGDFGEYIKHGLYKQEDANYPSGASVIYFGPTRISYSKP